MADSEPVFTRRSVLAGGSLLAVAVALGIDLSACSSTPAHPVLDDHELAVVTDATARLIPGPTDDPAEAGHPGAREAGVALYVATMLGALQHDPPLVYAGGPFSNRGGEHHDDMATFVTMPATVHAQWERRLADLADTYHAGIGRLDGSAGGDFTRVATARQDEVLAANPGGFTTVLFQHAIEGCYAVPEYRANADLVGWREVRFPGDTQPRGYPDELVTNSDGPDPITPQGIVSKALQLLVASSPGSELKPNIVGQTGGGGHG